MSQALATLDPEPLIARIADGAFLRDLALETGIDKRRLSEKLKQHPHYRSAKECSIEVQLDDAQLAISLAAEVSDIARAREMFRAAAWRAEREFPERWGTRPTVAMQLTGGTGQPGQQSGITVIFVTAPQQNTAPVERCIDSESQVLDANGKHV